MCFDTQALSDTCINVCVYELLKLRCTALAASSKGREGGSLQKIGDERFMPAHFDLAAEPSL